MPPLGNEINTNNAHEAWGRPGGLIDLLNAAGIDLNPAVIARLLAYAQMVREWNSFASLVSVRDADLLEDIHIPDSLSLAPIIKESRGEDARLLDIGSGGGLPSIPLKIVLPGLRMELVDRSVKKVGFLEKVLGSLRLGDVRVVHGNFPEAPVGTPDVITARAVEKPGWLVPRVTSFMGEGTVFLCQAGVPELGEKFHVKHVEDAWTRAGLRRGDLYLVERVG